MNKMDIQNLVTEIMVELLCNGKCLRSITKQNKNLLTTETVFPFLLMSQIHIFSCLLPEKHE